MAHETSAEAVRRIGLELIDENLHLLSDQTLDGELAIHEARKNFKRLRALLWLARDEIGADVFRRENDRFRHAALQLAALRDSAVMLMTLDKVRLPDAAAQNDTSFASIRAKLLAWQEEVSSQHLQERDTMAAVVAMLHEARPHFADLPLTQPDFAAFAGGLQRVYRQARRRMQQAYVAGSPELFHEWRRRVKYLWHQVEFFALLWPAVMAEMARELHHLSTLLGDAHDLVVLREMLLEQAETYGEEADLPVLLELLAERQTALETAAFPVGQRLFVERPSAFVRRLGIYWEMWQRHDYNGLSPEAPQVVWIGTQEAAAILRIPVTAVRARIARGEVPAVKVSGVWAIPRQALPNTA